MKTPEEIKNAMIICGKNDGCDGCPYCEKEDCFGEEPLLYDALAYINALEKRETSKTITVRDILSMYDGDVKLFCWKDHNLWINGMASALLDMGDKLLDLPVDCIEPRHTQADNRTRLYIWTKEAVAE